MIAQKLWSVNGVIAVIRETGTMKTIQRFGYFTTESNGHLSEYLPWYRKRPNEINRWIHPEHWIDVQTAEYLNHCRLKRNEYEEMYPQ
jgi:alpha-galactosidase